MILRNLASWAGVRSFMKRRWILTASVILLLLGGCATVGERRATPTTKAKKLQRPVLTLKTTEYRFDAPATHQGGLVTIKLDNTQGTEAHEAELIRLDEGRKTADYLTSVAQNQPPAFAHPAGGPGPVLPGKTALYNANVPAGSYIFVCHVPAPDNQEHLTKGMVFEIRLTNGQEGSLSRADATVRASEFQFTGAEAFESSSQTVKVVNDGQQPHNFGLVSLAPGKKATDLIPYLVPPGTPFPPGAPPFTGFNGLVATVAPGEEATRTLELAPSTSYALICFVPDIDGTPHFAKGMIQQVDIK
jgi:hypothetical protein